MAGSNNTTNSTLDENCSFSDIEIYAFIMLGIFGSLLTAIGLIGNILSLTVLSRMPVTSVTFYLLKVLAAVDIVYLSTYFVSVMIPEIMIFNCQEIDATVQYIQWIVFPLSSMSLTCSVWLLALVTMHRWFAISNRNGTENWLQKFSHNFQVFVVIFSSILIDLPKYFETYLVKEDDYVIRKSSSLSHNDLYLALYKFVLMILLRKAIPIIATAVLTFKLVKNLNKWSKRSASCLGKEHKWESQGRVTKVLIILALVLIICQTPSAIYPALRLFVHSNFIMQLITVAADLMTVLNSAVNFYLFYPFVPQFSFVLKQILLPGSNLRRKTSDQTNVTIVKGSLNCVTYNVTVENPNGLN